MRVRVVRPRGLPSCTVRSCAAGVCRLHRWFLTGSLVDGRELRGFSFLYGMIPTSSAPLLFAMRYSPASAKLLASSILLGLVVAGPLMFAAALFLEHDEDTDCPRLAELDQHAEITRDCPRLPAIALRLPEIAQDCPRLPEIARAAPARTFPQAS